MPSHTDVDHEAPVRIGVHRPDRPPSVIAEIEARVIRAELERRLGAVTLDLRVDGDDLGPWASMTHAAWPTGVDVVVEPDDLWAASQAPLTSLFARTVEPAAAEVRRRMLHHLGVLPVDRLDDAALEGFADLVLQPTDLWLIVSGATHVELSDRSVAALGRDAPDEHATTLDAAFDRLVTGWSEPLSTAVSARLQRAIAAARAADDRSAASADELARSQRVAADLIDELTSQLQVLGEQVARIDLQRTLESGDA